VNDVKARLESIVQSRAKYLRDARSVAIALATGTAATVAFGIRIFNAAVVQFKQLNLSPSARSLLAASGAGALTAFGVALALHFLGGANADIARLDKDLATVSQQLSSIERSNMQALATSHTALATFADRIAAAESAIGKATNLKNSTAPEIHAPAAGESVMLPEIGRLEKRIAELEEKMNMHGTPVSETSAALPADMDHGPSAFPPFETANFMPMLIWLALSFGLLYLLMSKIALPRVENILRARADKISNDISEANAFRLESEKAAAQHDKTIADARAKALALAQETHERLNAETETKRAAQERELNVKLAAAEAQIAQMKTKAMGNVEAIANETAAAIVEHITGKPADPKAIKAAIASA
jgi:F-type H+-transporting ATPase subunit b